MIMVIMMTMLVTRIMIMVVNDENADGDNDYDDGGE